MKDTILIGVTGSIAVWKICDLIRNIQKNSHLNYKIQVIMTEKASEFVGPLTFSTLTGYPVFAGRIEDSMHHIELKNKAVLYLIAPATANIIGKMASGIADDIVSTSYLAADCPVIVAPAMNPNMYNHKAVKRNLGTLKSDGVHIIGSESGEVICGDTGEGRLADINIIEKTIENILLNK
jgi:phosphopantothenoylcysteine decarboxylase/phosphopantothenoylcysteine decarboxylase/phosphopantothenate--cysteine ligase